MGEPKAGFETAPVSLAEGGRLVRRLLRYLAPRRQLTALTVVFGTAGFLLAFVYPWLIGATVDVVSRGRGGPEEQEAIALLAIAAGLTALLHAAVVYGRGHSNVRLGDAVVTDLRAQLFAHLQQFGTAFYARERTGALLSRLLHDAQGATALVYHGLIVVVLDALQLALAFAFLVAMSGKLAVACLFVFPAYAFVFLARNPRVRRASERLQEDLTQLTATVAEQLAGQEVVKVFGATDRERARFRARLAEHHRLVVAQSHEGHLVASASELLVDLGTTLVVGAGGWLALHGELTPGLLTRFLGYLVLMYAPVRRLAELNVTYQASLAALRRVFGLLDRRPLIVDAPCAVVTPPRRGHVRFVGVGFHHEGDDGEAPRRVLEGIDLEARPGERIAIVGPSGAGKTTLVSLLPRLLDPSEGVVWIDGVDTRGYALTALRSAIALVQQDPFLFSATLRENIAYGCPDATHDAVVRAAEAAYAHEFIARLPRGYETRVGERGVTLSGGQRQRVAIARALLRDPRILILDEATSALDTESERMVQEALERLMQGRTCFVVAHRLSTIRRADRVVVLDGGRIVETGRHACLTHRDGVYARLVRAESG